MPGRRTPPTLARNQSPPAFSARSPRDASGRESPGAGPKGCLGRLAFRAAGSLRPASVKRPETWNGEKQQPFSSKECSPWIAVHKIRKMRLAVAVRFPVLLFSQVGFFFMPVTWAQRLDSSSKVMSRLRDTDTREKAVMVEAGIGVMSRQAVGCRKPPEAGREAGRDREGSFPRASGGSAALLTPSSWTFNLRTKTVNLHRFQPPSLRHFVLEAVAH
ncbi:uncharacterized protein [Pseudorca crassidens]|uniref:uncharacterized protein isoform X2 n=1 Tax=Pseudorca crassidens TaxID=82174 RepID=UPI00352FC523